MLVILIINKLLALLLLSSTIEENGWVSVDKPQKQAQSQHEEVDPSIWTVFAKEFGSEKVLIRFPEDPGYRYPQIDQGDKETMEIDSTSGETLHRLNVLKFPDQPLDELIQKKINNIQSEEGALLVQTDQIDGQMADLLYRSQGKWVRERLILTDEHLYILQSASETLEGSSHTQFIASFDLEKRDENKVFSRPFHSEK